MAGPFPLRLARFAPFAFLVVPGPAHGEDEIVRAKGWTQVDLVEAGPCRAEILGNGRVYRIAGSGFRPGEVVRFRLVSSAAKGAIGGLASIDNRIGIRGDGSWRQFYIPFIPNRPGGRVTVSLASATCALTLGFDWQRREV